MRLPSEASNADSLHDASAPALARNADSPTGQFGDRLGRRLQDLRISVTDRCNFRCTYCMPRDVFGRDYPFLPQSSLLSFEEITRLAGVFVAHGVRKIRLTGGEPLLRKNLDRLVGMLARLRTPAGERPELTLTTNGALLARFARPLREAGLDRLTVSLDSLDDAVFRRMNDSDYPVADVLAGIEAARQAGFGRIKVNMVVKRGVNDDGIVPMAAYFRGSPLIVRFIEYMDVGSSNGWRLDEVVPSAEVVRQVDEAFGLEPIAPNYRGEVAQRWRYRDGMGEIGVISSVTRPFCADCSRARLSTEGKLFTCLFATHGHDLRALLRNGVDDAGLSTTIGAIWGAREDRYSALRSSATTGLRKIEMSYIGG
ncbi:MAG: GTP 3',8-cyclase MoaA [Burkholderiaceae bacterium]